MSQTFAELGIHFPLFEAPVDQCSNYCGRGSCQVCGESDRHLFSIGLGGYLTMPCSSCGTRVGFHVASEGSVACPSCTKSVKRPVYQNREIQGCAECLREGRVLLSKDTNYGMIGWEQLISGVTEGLPRLNRELGHFSEIELVQTAPPSAMFGKRQPASYGVKLPRETMEELLRTPGFHSWQGQKWLFEGLRPMIFVGSWVQVDFHKNAGGEDGESLFRKAISQDRSDWVDLGRGSISSYVFRSPTTNSYRGYYDLD